MTQPTYRDDEVKKTEFALKNGVDVSLSVSYPLKQLIERSEWIEDEETQVCMICNAQFSLFVRRHHCRRCGRVLCDKCSPKSYYAELNGQDRLCLVCDAVMELDDRNGKMGPGDYEVATYMADDKMLQAITREDLILRSEVVRLFQNSCRNDAVRAKLQTWPDFFVCVKQLMKKASGFILTKDQSKFFKQHDLTNASAVTILGICLGFLVNYCASAKVEFAQFLFDNGFLELIFSCLNTDMDLLRRELGIWALRNMSQNENVAKAIAKNELFMPIAFEHLRSGVKNIIDCTLALMGNVVRHTPSLGAEMIPLQSQPYAAKLELIQFQAKFKDMSVSGIAFYVRLCAFLCTDVALRDELAAQQFFNSIIQLVVDFEKDEKMPNRDLYQGFVVGEVFNALAQIIAQHQDDEEFTEKLAKMIGSSAQFLSTAITTCTKEDSFVSKASSNLLKHAFTFCQEPIYKPIAGTKALKKAFVATLIQTIKYEHHFKEVTENMTVVLKKVGKKDAAGIGKEVRDKLSEE